MERACLQDITLCACDSVEGGELFDRIIDENYNLTELDTVLFIRQICEGLQYMHKMYILHLDLKVNTSLIFVSVLQELRLLICPRLHFTAESDRTNVKSSVNMRNLPLDDGDFRFVANDEMNQ